MAYPQFGGPPFPKGGAELWEGTGFASHSSGPPFQGGGPNCGRVHFWETNIALPGRVFFGSGVRAWTNPGRSTGVPPLMW